MKKQLLGFFACALLLGGCAAKDAATIEERPASLFPNPEGAWVGDVMAQADENGVHLNYLYETDHNAVGYHPIHRFTTTDFCKYEDEGEMLPFATELDAPDLAVGTGCFFVDQQGVSQCYYTGHNDKASEFGINKECIMHASSTDNKSWEKHPEDTFFAPKGYSTDDFRDPFVMWKEDEGCYWMLVGARKEGIGSCIIKYTSKDLSEWEFQGDYYESPELYFMECPDLFSIGEWNYLVFSWNNVTYYRMSKSPNGPWEKPEIDTFDGNAFYAAKTVEYDGIRYLIGFIDRKHPENDNLQYTWAGSLCPYELTQKEDGTLGVKMPHQYEDSYFSDYKTISEVPDKISETTIFGKLPESMLLSCKVTFPETDGKAGFLFGGTKEEGYTVLLDQKTGRISYNAYPNEQAFPFEQGQTYEVKLVVNKEVVIVYVDDTKVLSNRIYQAVGNTWGVVIQEGNVEFSDIVVKGK